MSKRKYLVLFRSQPTLAGAQTGPSPEQMQQMFAAYKTWMERSSRTTSSTWATS